MSRCVVLEVGSLSEHGTARWKWYIDRLDYVGAVKLDSYLHPYSLLHTYLSSIQKPTQLNINQDGFLIQDLPERSHDAD